MTIEHAPHELHQGTCLIAQMGRNTLQIPTLSVKNKMIKQCFKSWVNKKDSEGLKSSLKLERARPKIRWSQNFWAREHKSSREQS